MLSSCDIYICQRTEADTRYVKQRNLHPLSGELSLQNKCYWFAYISLPLHEKSPFCTNFGVWCALIATTMRSQMKTTKVR